MSTLLGANTATPTAAREFTLGTRHCPGDDGSEWLYVQASGAITGAGYVVTISEAYQAAMASNSAADRGDLVGVAPAAFADDEYGWVQVKGPCNIRVAASCAANVIITTTTTAGQLDDAAGAGTKTIEGAVLTTAAGGSAGNAAGILNYPAVGVTN